MDWRDSFCLNKERYTGTRTSGGHVRWPIGQLRSPSARSRWSEVTVPSKMLSSRRCLPSRLRGEFPKCLDEKWLPNKVGHTEGSWCERCCLFYLIWNGPLLIWRDWIPWGPASDFKGAKCCLQQGINHITSILPSIEGCWEKLFQISTLWLPNKMLFLQEMTTGIIVSNKYSSY